MKRINLLILISFFLPFYLQSSEIDQEKEKTINVTNNTTFNCKLYIGNSRTRKELIIPVEAKKSSSKTSVMPKIDGFIVEFGLKKEVFIISVGDVFMFEDTNKKIQNEALRNINFLNANSIQIFIETSPEKEPFLIVKTDNNNSSIFSKFKKFIIFIS